MEGRCRFSAEVESGTGVGWVLGAHGGAARRDGGGADVGQAHGGVAHARRQRRW